MTTVTLPSRSDIVVSVVSGSLSRCKTFGTSTRTCRLTAIVTVENRGTQDAPAFLLNLYSSWDSTLEANTDTLLQQWRISKLKVGQGKTKS